MFIRILAVLLLNFLPLLAKPLNVPVKAESALLINADSGVVLFEKNAHKKQFPASITKVATALYALQHKKYKPSLLIAAEQECIASISEEAKRRSNYKLPSHWVEFNSGHMGIKKGEKLTLNDLMHGMLVASANDAANVIAYQIAGNISEFMNEVNAYILSLGCRNTHFENPHGLHHPQHQTTAHDMAIIVKHALKNSTFREIVKTVRYTRPKTNMQEASILLQTNQLLRKGEFYYDKAIGVKTGRTSHANNNFVAAANDGKRTLIAVLLNVKERSDMFKDAIHLFETAFNQPKVEKVLIKPGLQKHVLKLKGTKSLLKTYAAEETSISYYPAEEPQIKAFLVWDSLSLPIAKDQKVGEVLLKTENGATFKKVPLFANEDLKESFVEKFKNFFTLKIFLGIFFLSAMVIALRLRGR